jgi:hypothetical protein
MGTVLDDAVADAAAASVALATVMAIGCVYRMGL